MPELTLESLAKRVDVLETEFARARIARRDWLQSLETSDDNEFTRQMWADIEATREAEREAARRGEDLES